MYAGVGMSGTMGCIQPHCSVPSHVLPCAEAGCIIGAGHTAERLSTHLSDIYCSRDARRSYAAHMAKGLVLVDTLFV